MADKKISQLTAATLPLVGTEVLPIVQSDTTVKVANNDLRPKQIQSNATSGVLQVTGPAAAATRVMTTPDANFTAARTDAAQSFTGDQTLSTGNLIIGTSGKGIDFSATPQPAGMTSELLADYEEGTWTPTMTGTSVTYAKQSGTYIKVGRLVTVQGLIQPNGGTPGAVIQGLPYTATTGTDSSFGMLVKIYNSNGGITYASGKTEISAFIERNTTNISLEAQGSASASLPVTVSNTAQIYFAATYVAAS